MKTLPLVLIGIGLAATATIVAVKWQGNPPPPADAAVQPAGTPATKVDRPPRTSTAMASAPEMLQQNPSTPEPPPGTTQVSAAKASPGTALPSASTAKSAVVLSQPLQTLVSRQASHAQKQAAWKQLRNTGELNKAVAELEQAVKDDPSDAEYAAVLGQAYIQKLAASQDGREKVMLAMQADESFDQALKLDPTNWEARYAKAESLCYWPAEMGKSQEVMQHLVTLIEQQEAQSLQPHFVQSYILLGAQYQKAGYADHAKQTWQRGAALFPDNNALRQKLAGLQ